MSVGGGAIQHLTVVSFSSWRTSILRHHPIRHERNHLSRTDETAVYALLARCRLSKPTTQTTGCTVGTTLHRNFSSSSQHQSGRRWNPTATCILLGSTVVTILVTTGVATRHFRTCKIQQELCPLQLDDQGNWMNTYHNQQHPLQQLSDLQVRIQRAGLMGLTARSVKAELEHIRQWHSRHGFKGGLVVRDLTMPLYSGGEEGSTDFNNNKTTNENEVAKNRTLLNPFDSQPWWKRFWKRLIAAPSNVQDVQPVDELIHFLPRRECYYLYYEIESTGRLSQQLFCRGTTLNVDVWTCLQAWTHRDNELGGCRLHRGFAAQANRILEDALPLLAPPNVHRATIELCGHSLGGAVATILAAKLKQRGYNVVRLTTVGEPASVQTKHDAELLRQQLQGVEHLRIQDERDVVTFLPFFGKHIGDKLWLATSLTNTNIYFVPDKPDYEWTDSFWINFYLPELVASKGKPHRIPLYLKRLRALSTTSTTP